jgi:hypothetical protein
MLLFNNRLCKVAGAVLHHSPYKLMHTSYVCEKLRPFGGQQRQVNEITSFFDKRQFMVSHIDHKIKH